MNPADRRDVLANRSGGGDWITNMERKFDNAGNMHAYLENKKQVKELQWGTLGIILDGVGGYYE